MSKLAKDRYLVVLISSSSPFLKLYLYEGKENTWKKIYAVASSRSFSYTFNKESKKVLLP